MLRFGVPVVVSINRFSSDHEGELEVLEASAIASGAHAVVRTTVHGEGVQGVRPLHEPWSPHVRIIWRRGDPSRP